MKKNIAIISFLVSMMIVISHDIIPHHHVYPDESEIVSGQLNDRKEHKSKNNNQKNHFPQHQHLLSDGDFITGRNNISLNKVSSDTHEDIDCLSSLFDDFNDNKYFTGFVRVIKQPRSPYPVLISINSTRGSPSIS